MLQIFLQYLPHVASNDSYRYVKELHWPSADGKLPLDEPVCGFRDDKCKTTGMPSSTLAVVVGVPLFVLALLLAASSIIFLRFWYVFQSAKRFFLEKPAQFDPKPICLSSDPEQSFGRQTQIQQLEM